MVDGENEEDEGRREKGAQEKEELVSCPSTGFTNVTVQFPSLLDKPSDGCVEG